MLVKELLTAAVLLPPDARVVLYLDQDVAVTDSQWSDEANGHCCDYFDIAEAEQDVETVGAAGAKCPCLVLIAGPAVV